MESLSHRVPTETLASLLASLVDTDGTPAHPYARGVIVGERQSFVRNLVDFADFVHLLCLLHGSAPGFVDLAATRTTEVAAREWLVAAMNSFVTERAYLSRLAVLAGPLPSTSGHHETTTIITQQRHALEMLAQSDRKGCSFGASVALVLEWDAMRTILDAGAARLGIEIPACTLPSRKQTLDMLAALPDPQRLTRAMQFGASQLVGQHRGLWDLLEARAMVRQEG